MDDKRRGGDLLLTPEGRHVQLLPVHTGGGSYWQVVKVKYSQVSRVSELSSVV